MPAINLTDLSNAKLDVDHIAVIATSAAPTAVDRFGHTKRTISGIVDAGQMALSAEVAETAADGLVITTTGRFFSIPSPDSAESLILYKNVAGVATERKRYPSAAAVQAIAEAVRASVDQPNLFTAARLAFTTLPDTVGGSISQTSVGGLRAGALVSETVNGIGRCKWSFPVSGFPSGKASAQIVMDSSTVGTSGTISIVERNAAGAAIATTIIATALGAAITVPTAFQVSGIALNPLTASVDLDVNLAKTTGDKLRVSVLRSMLMCDGLHAGFRQPPLPVVEVPIFSRFPNPQLTDSGSSMYQATKVTEAGESVLSMVAGVGVTSQVFYEELAVGILAPGSTLTLIAEAMSDVTGSGTSADISIVCLDAAGAAIGLIPVSSYATAGAYQAQTVTKLVPEGTVKIRYRFVKRTQAAYGKFRRVSLTSSSPLAKTIAIPSTPASSGAALRITVSPGSDFPTIQAGVDAAKPFGLVIVREGDYAPFSVSGFYGRIMAYRNERVRVIGGTLLAGITKTGGATAVYQAALAVAPNHYIWGHDVPDVDTFIPDSERLPTQRGETYRLPSTRYFEATSIAAVDAATKPAWFYSAGVLYFKTRDGAAPGSQKLYAPASGSVSYACVSGGTGDEDVEIQGIAALYGYNGFRLAGCARVRLNRCDAMFSATDGFALNDNLIVQNIHPRAGGNGNDGTNGHNSQTNVNNTQSSVMMVEPWCHDSWDDADSLHERFMATYIGGLYEYSGSGIATAYGAHLTLHGGVVRKNGLASGNGNPAPKNLGVSAIGDAIDGGKGTQVICYNTISSDNGYNFSAGGVGNTILCINTKSLLSTVAGYSGASGGSIELMDCTDSGSLVAKTGTVIVKNTALVV